MYEDIKNSIKNAIGSHGLWKGRLRSAIDKQKTDWDVDYVRSCHNCDFGKWLDSGKATLSKFEHYQRVYEKHKNLHITTAEVITLALAGQKKEAQDLLEGKFQNESLALTVEMMEWTKSLKSAS